MPQRVTRTDAELLLKTLHALFKTRALYPPGHGAVQKAAQALDRALVDVFQTPDPLLLGVADGYLVVGGVAFLGDNLQARELGQRLEARGLEGVLLLPTVRSTDLAGFLEWLRAGEAQEWENPRVTVTRLNREGEAWARGRRLHLKAVAALESVCRDVEQGRIPDPTHAQECVAGLAQLLDEHPTLVRGLTLLKDYDQYTYFHSVNVSVLALGIGRQIKLTDPELECIGIGGLFHDIGKTRTPVDVIRKPGRLSINEVTLVRWHPVYGRDILDQMAGLPPAVPRLVYEHHMRFDGGGYPGRPERAPLHPLSQLIAVSDVYDAMTTHRPYSAPLPLPVAVQALVEGSGTQLEPAVVRAFLSMMGPTPVGSLVRLASGEAAVVTRIGDEGAVNEVRLYSTPAGTLLAEAEQLLRPVGSGDVTGWVTSLSPRIDPFKAVSSGR
ncbi:MAG: HD domain-containing protein [Deltaproteobacteria bacterium]|nr:HD domain-containing protein [Deltaproteobacteria bacterium]